MPPSIITTTTAAILLLSLPATARLDETPAQCNERYGTPVREIAGNNGVAGARIYNKAGMEIIVIFIGPSTNDALAGMVLYNSNTAEHGVRSGSLKPEEEGSFLATVPGRWEPYNTPPTLRTGASGKALAPVPSLLEKRRAECHAAVKAIVAAFYPLGMYCDVTDAKHMENIRFAVRVPSGLAIASYTAVPIIQKWRTAVQRQNTETARPPPKDLSGF